MENINHLKFLMEYHYKCFQDRREYHWKVNFALWGGIAAIVAGLLRENIKFQYWILVIESLTLLVIYIFVWMRGLKKAHAIDKKFWISYRELIHHLIKNESITNLPEYEGIRDEVTWMKWRLPQKTIGQTEQEAKIVQPLMEIDIPKFSVWFDWSSITEIALTVILLLGAIMICGK